MLHEDLTSQIIASFYGVYNALGYGFLEKVYENALIIELRKRGLILLPGMPAEVLINTGDRTFFEYLMQPLSNIFARSLIED